MEITGSAKEKNGKKKFPMLDFFKNKQIPKLDAKAEKMSRELNKNIIVRYQHDNTSPHVEKHPKAIFGTTICTTGMAYWVSTDMFTYNRCQ